MKTKHEGIRRLSIFMGVLGEIAFLFYVFGYVGEVTLSMPIGEWIGLIVFIAISFFCPFLLVRFLGWVFLGFKESGQDKIQKD